MKKLFAIVAVLGLLGTAQVAAQTEEVNNVQQTEAVDSAAVTSDSVVAEEPAVEEPAAEAPVQVAEEEGLAGVHKTIKTKFIEGGAEFMALVAIAMVIGLAFC
ncbi:MAG: MotA/TolQ/ExbB proton channel family protein, partial [Bacteroidaceae bacterium]|nr:MotA/TolQ/ExbB proton channel family protein [Bacteroidaceae bacterium]